MKSCRLLAVFLLGSIALYATRDGAAQADRPADFDASAAAAALPADSSAPASATEPENAAPPAPEIKGANDEAREVVEPESLPAEIEEEPALLEPPAAEPVEAQPSPGRPDKQSARLREKLRAADVQQREDRKTIRDLTRRVKTAEKAAGSAEEQRTRLEQDVRELKAAEEKNARLIKELRQQLPDSEAKAAELQDQIEDAVKTLADKDRQIARLDLELRAFRKQATEEIATTRAEAEAEVDAARAALVASEKQRESLEEARQSEGGPSGKTAKAIRSLEATVADRDAELAARNRALEEKKRLLDALAADLSAARQKAAEVEPASVAPAEAKEIIAKLQGELDRQTAVAAEKDRQIAALTQEIDSLHEQMKGIQKPAGETADADHRRMTRELEARDREYRELKSAHEQNAQILESLRQNLAQAQKNAAAQESDARTKFEALLQRDEQLRDLKAEVEKLRAQAESRAKQAARAQQELEEEAAALRAAKAEDSKAMEKLRRQLAAAEAQSLKLKSDDDEKAGALSSKADQIDSIQRLLKTRDREYRELQTAHEQNVQTLESLRKNFAQAQKDIAIYKADARKNSESPAQRDEEVRDLKAKLEKLQTESTAEQEQVLDKADALVKQAVETQQELEKEAAALRAVKAEDSKTIGELHQKLAATDKELLKLKADDDDRIAELARKDKRIESIQAQLTTTRQEAETRLNQAADALDGLRKEIAAQKEVDAQKAKLAADLQAQGVARQNENAQLQAALADKEAALSARVTEAGSLARDLAEARAQATNALHEIESAKQKAAADVQQVAQDRDRLQEAIDALQATDRKSQAAAADLQQKIADLDGQISDLKTALGEKAHIADEIRQTLRDQETLRKEIADLKAKNADQARTISRRESELTDVARAASEMEVTLAKKTRELANRGAEIENTRAEMEAVRKKSVQNEKALAGLLENSRLKAALAENKSAEWRRLTGDLAQARTAETQSRKAAAALTQQLKYTTEEATRLKSAAADKDAALFARDQKINELTAALSRQDETVANLKVQRAARPVKAEVTPAVGPADQKKQRVARGQMAANYTSLGKYREAEQEYLALLQLDPTDADAHYNLGILYDDRIKDKAMAAVHYRGYLRLRPNAADVAEVKRWLTEAEAVRR